MTDGVIQVEPLLLKNNFSEIIKKVDDIKSIIFYHVWNPQQLKLNYSFTHAIFIYILEENQEDKHKKWN